MKVAFHTLGCKVNQYDSQAMLELMMRAGYEPVSFQEQADIYVINTCTVTGTGDRKSLQLARRIKRDHPASLLVLCGCLAQLQGERLLAEAQADLILGTQFRGQIADLISQVLKDHNPRCAVQPFSTGIPFEPLDVTSFSEHTRATVKIQEGCNNHCSYCVIPAVRGPIRSRMPEDILREAIHLRDRGFKEIVVTGIHLASYGRDVTERSISLLDAIQVIHSVDGIKRIRLGSLEPVIVTPDFCKSLTAFPKVCPQFHLALQSGSDTVLARMRRRYNTSQYLNAVSCIRSAYPSAALTTDILTGFPGESEDEFIETKRFIEKAGYARIHVFPYSPRPDTPAAVMSNQIPEGEKDRRVRELIQTGNHAARKYLESWLGKTAEVLVEEQVHGCWEGYTPEYIRVTLPPDASCVSGQLVPVRFTGFTEKGMSGSPWNQ